MKPIYWILMVILILAVVLFFVLRKSPKDKALKEELEKAKAVASVSFPLTKGDNNSAVGAVQKYLNSKSSEYDCPKVNRETSIYKTAAGDKKLFPVGIDNSFGEQTYQALIRCYNVSQVSREQYDNLIAKL